MRSKLKVFVAVFLMAAMIFTLLPASTAIAGPNGRGNRKPGKTVEETQALETEAVEADAPIEEVETVIETESVETVEETEAPTETEAVQYPYFEDTKTDEESGISVKVEAPEGALPDGTEMVLTALTDSQLSAVADKVDGNVVEAIDIAFWNNGEEIEPRIPIKVTMSSAKIAEVEETTVVHVADDTGEVTEVEQVDEPSAADEVVFEADSFSVYAVVDSNPEGGFDFDEVIGGERVKVKAPDGAFPVGTEMRIASVADDEDLAKVAASLDSSQIYSLFALDISFWYKGSEIEPKYPVEVTWESANIDSNDCQLMHLNDAGKVELVNDAEISATEAVFTADSFSEYILVSTTRQSTVPIEHFAFNPSSISSDVDVTEITSGDIAENAPVIDGYTFKNATVQLDGQTDIAVQVGAFIAKYENSEDSTVTKEEYKVYYRTKDSLEASDIIVLIADQKITLNYETTPYSVTYVVNYGGRYYTIGEDELPADLADLVLTGPEAVNENTTYDQAVVLGLPRGYSATVRMSNESSNQAPALGEGSEPNYTCTDGWTVTPNDYPFTINGTYTISNVSSDLTVTVNVTKRTSYRFTAQPAFNTAYFGGTGTAARYQDVRPSASYNFNSNDTTFSFTTKNSSNIEWAMDSLNINKEAILVPFVDNTNRTASVSKTLTSGTIITVSAEYLASGTYRGNRKYTITVSNCYENITITGGNLHNVLDKPEWVLQERENLAEFDYLGGNWLPLVSGEPMSYAGWDAAGNSNTARWNAWRNNRINFTPRVIRFKVADGYVNPQIKYVTPEGNDDYSRVGDVTLADAATNFYHRITSAPDADGYYYFSLKGNSSSQYMGLLSAKAELARYGVSYDPGTVSGASVPEFDDGGKYGDGSLKGYNIEDNDIIAISKVVPSDPANTYVFLNYTIDGDDSGTPYAPSQKVDLKDVTQFAEYDSSKGEYVIPLVAHWVRKEEAETVTIRVNFILDDNLPAEHSVDVQVTKNSSVYIDIDSEEMVNFMEKYNWQLFYDEIGSNPYIEKAEEDQEVDLRIYSKFYVYHSATNTLELHTTKEMETGTGDGRTIGNLNLAALTTNGYYYGGYYKDYLGAHVGNTADGTNLVKAAADLNNSDGLLSTADIVKLSNKLGVTIPEYAKNKGTQYDPVTNADHLAYWTRANAFTTSMKNSDTSWFSNRGSNDTAVLQTGGTGTSVKIARAGIYYLHEVPPAYLATPKVATVKDDYGNGKITKMFLLSAADLNIFRAGGTKIKTADTKGSFAKNFTLTKYDDGTDQIVAHETKIANDLFGVNGYLIVTDGKTCLANGEYKLDPYWITYDSVTVHGSDVAEAGHVRTITVNGNTVE